jgi:hypothetical protein
MIFSLLFSVLALAADLNRDCVMNSPALQRFFSEYVEAHANADRAALKKMISKDFWETFGEYAPKKPSKHLLRTLAKGDFCHVQWANTESGKKQEEPAWFRLDSSWKLDGVSGDLED